MQSTVGGRSGYFHANVALLLAHSHLGRVGDVAKSLNMSVTLLAHVTAERENVGNRR